jgi:hypothetical protein
MYFRLFISTYPSATVYTLEAYKPYQFGHFLLATASIYSPALSCKLAARYPASRKIKLDKLLSPMHRAISAMRYAAIRAGLALSLASLNGCIPIGYVQYQLISSDGVVAQQQDAGSGSRLEYKSADGTTLTLAVNADSGSSGMSIHFYTTVPAGSDPQLSSREVQLVDCSPARPGPLKIGHVQVRPPYEGRTFFQWWIDLPGTPQHCTFTAPDFNYRGQQWKAPTVQARRHATTPLILDLTKLPKS